LSWNAVRSASTIRQGQAVTHNSIVLSRDRQNVPRIIIRSTQTIEDGSQLANSYSAFVGKIVVGYTLVETTETARVGVKGRDAALFNCLCEVEGVDYFAEALGVGGDSGGGDAFENGDCAECETA
jgi:hypothetical protein